MDSPARYLRAALLFAGLLLVPLAASGQEGDDGGEINISTLDGHIVDEIADTEAPGPSGGLRRFASCTRVPLLIHRKCVVGHRNEARHQQNERAMSRMWRAIAFMAAMTETATRRTHNMLRDFEGTYDWAKARVSTFSGIPNEIEGYTYQHSADRHEALEEQIEQLAFGRPVRTSSNRWESIELVLKDQLEALADADEYAEDLTLRYAELGESLGFESRLRVGGGSGSGLTSTFAAPPAPVHIDPNNSGTPSPSPEFVAARQAAVFAGAVAPGDPDLELDEEGCPIEDIETLPVVAYHRSEIMSTGARVGSTVTSGEVDARVAVIRGLKVSEEQRLEYQKRLRIRNLGRY